LGPLIVTGGAGFIGGHLVPAVLRSRSQLLVIDRVARPASFRVNRRLSYRRINVRNINDVFSESLRKGAIVHLAAETSVENSVRHPLSTVKSNIEVTCTTLELARRIDCERFVFASTAAVYGDRRGRCRETDSLAPTSPYAVSKLASEYYCRVYSQLYGIPTVILRYFNVYGPGQTSEYAGVITRFARRVLKERPPVIFGNGSQTRDFVFVDDVVKATLTSLQKPLPGGTIMNIGTGRPIRIVSLAEKILGILNLRHLRPVFVSPRKGDVKHSEADISLARAKINFRPSHSLDSGLRATIEWLRRAN